METRNSKIRQTLTAAVVGIMLSLPAVQHGVACAGQNPFLGEIEMVGFNFAPIGWAKCDGQLMAIVQNPALFSLLGTTYGGDGVQTFALPDLRGRGAIHQGQGPGLTPFNMGDVGGTENVFLTFANLPPHNHPAVTTVSVTGTAAIPAQSGNGTTDTPTGSTYLAKSPRNLQYSTVAPNVSMAGGPISATATASTAIGLTGQCLPIANRSPYLVVNYIIALEGIFPSRD